MPHNIPARKATKVTPVILFNGNGRTVDSYRPESESLENARPAEHRHEWIPVVGPHLLTVRKRYNRSSTGVIGISLSRRKRDGRLSFIVNLGSTNRRFPIDTLGRTEAFRRAVALRRAHEKKIELANAVILRARERNAVAVTVGGAL